MFPLGQVRSSFTVSHFCIAGYDPILCWLRIQKDIKLALKLTGVRVEKRVVWVMERVWACVLVDRGSLSWVDTAVQILRLGSVVPTGCPFHHLAALEPQRDLLALSTSWQG